MLQRFFYSFMYLRKPPWDTGISPPELIEFIESHPAGRVLDLGCGTGTNVLTLAQRGWQVTGVDFMPRAIQKARVKIRAAGLQAELRLEDVTRLKNISGLYNLILDIGCFHSLSPASRQAYLTNIDRLLAPGGTFLLYAWLRQGTQPGGPGLTEGEIHAMQARLSLARRIDSTERGRSPSAWFTWVK